ncbi:MAG: hypothetical protein ACRDSS_08880, partial [Actinocrinis sp.]
MSGGYDHDGHGHSDEHSHGHGHEHSHTRQGVRDHSHGPRRPAFEADQHALTLYYRALCGRQCEIVAYDDDADMWQHPDTMSTVRLPARPPAESGRWYQVAMTHRALHHSLGTFQLDLDKPELLFARLRPRADQHSVRLRPRADQYSEQPKPQVERANVPPLESFARLFGRTALAIEVFALMEDMRVDVTAHRLYPGLAPAYREACRIALADRPELTLLPPRSAVAEALVQFTLGAKTVTAPDALRTPLARVVSATRRMADPRATVESAAEAAIRVYGVLAGLPNVGGHRAVRPIAFDELAADIDVSTAGFEIEAFREELRLEGDDVLDVRFTPVRFRDSPGPRYLGAQASGMPLQEAILRMTPDDADETGEAGDPDADGFAEKSLQAERGGVDVTAPQRPESPPEPLPHDHGPDLDSDHEHVEGRMRAAGRDEFVYPEWDNIARRYLQDWCLVRVRPPKAVRSDKARRKAMARYGHLLPSVIAALERVHPAGRDLVTRQPSGDDLDLDACIDALIDLRTGVEPSDRVYASMRERRRDVAVA